MNIINSYMIELARKSRGFTQKDLSKKLDCTQGTISKIEQGINDVDDELLKKLSTVLEYPTSFFFQNGRIIAPTMKYRRSRASLSAKIRDQIDSHHNVIALVINELLEAVEIPENNVPDWPSYDWESPSEIAQALRQYWKLPRGPINNLTAVLESAGIIIVETDFTTRKFDGVYYPFPDLPPIIFVDKNIPGDRLRFTLAHELGHIIMHQKPKNLETIENETDEFSAEFMLPAEDIRPHLHNLNLQKLANLKQTWKMSMASILVRAERLSTISNRKYRYLWSQMSKAGYKTQEPKGLQIPREKSQILDKLIKLHIDELDYDLETLSRAVNLNVSEFSDVFEKRPKLKLLSLDHN